MHLFQHSWPLLGPKKHRFNWRQVLLTDWSPTLFYFKGHRTGACAKHSPSRSGPVNTMLLAAPLLLIRRAMRLTLPRSPFFPGIRAISSGRNPGKPPTRKQCPVGLQLRPSKLESGGSAFFLSTFRNYKNRVKEAGLCPPLPCNNGSMPWGCFTIGKPIGSKLRWSPPRGTRLPPAVSQRNRLTPQIPLPDF